MRALRLALAVTLAVTLVLLVPAGAARGHGGSVSPPPPPPPRAPNPPWNAPRGHRPTQVMPGVGGPIVTPGDGGGPQSVRPVGRRTAPVTPTAETAWTQWWRLNGDPITPERRAVRVRRAIVTPEGRVAEEGDAAGWVARRDALVQARIVPLLLRLLDPGKRVPDDVRASAALALGKVAFERAHVERLLAWMLQEDAKEIVRESAALSLGLLRRTEPHRQFPAFVLDPIRAKLLMVFDRHVDGERVSVPQRTREFALFAMGLLGDQPFQEDPQSVDGKLMTSLLWQRLVKMQHRDVDAPVALVTAIGLQPAAGATPEMLEGLGDMALGRKVDGRDYRAWVGGHALTALCRLGGARGRSVALRALGDERLDAAHRVAAILALAQGAEAMSAAERRIALHVVQGALGREQELICAGLLDIALGRLLAADLAAGGALFAQGGAPQRLVERVDTQPWYLRGYAALGLGFAAREAARAGDEGAAWRATARNLLLGIVQDEKMELPVRSAGVLALGLAGFEEAAPGLVSMLRRESVAPELRSAAALGLAHLRPDGKEAPDALAGLVADEHAEPELRARAALALSAFGHPDAVTRLVTELKQSHRTWHVAAVTAALGRLGDLEAVETLALLAENEEEQEVVRALAVVALGILGDPEEVPSLSRIARGVPYPIRTNAMEELFTIL